MPIKSELDFMRIPSDSQCGSLINSVRQTIANSRSRFVLLALVIGAQLYTPSTKAQSLNGVTVGASFSTVKSLKLRPMARDLRYGLNLAKFRLPNDNEISITYSGRADSIIYVEVDWNKRPESIDTGVPGLLFGTTTLGDIRQKYGSNGFAWVKNPLAIKDDTVVAFNAYEIKNRPGVAVVFVTAVAKADATAAVASSDAMGRNFRLYAIILANERYLDSMWGNEKNYDPDIREIRW